MMFGDGDTRRGKLKDVSQSGIGDLMTTEELSVSRY